MRGGDDTASRRRLCRLRQRGFTMSGAQGITDADFTHIAITVKSEPEPNIFIALLFLPIPLTLILSPVGPSPHPRPKAKGNWAREKAFVVV